MIAIIDYGMGNIHSVKKALESLGGRTIVTNSPGDIESADKVVLPGVGAFGDAMEELLKQGLVPAIKDYVGQKRTFLGICLGMHLLFEASEESPGAKGLGILKGNVRRFKDSPGLKVPHMGWNQLQKAESECPLLKGIPDDAYVYFCHSYYPVPRDIATIAATTDYGKGFASVVSKDSVFGLQFHPEKSQATGLAMLKNFVEMRC